MNLRDSLNNPDHGGPMPDPMEGREDYLWATAYVHGYGEATGDRLAASTNGRTMRLHNLTANTRSAVIHRKGLETRRGVRVAVQAQLDAMPYWEAESDEWGPDPWANTDGAE